MLNRISLRGRIYAVLIVLVLISLAGGTITIWYTYRMQGLLTSILDRRISAFQAAEGLETALVNQKGFVSYFFLDGNPEWLRQLGEYRQIFRQRLRDARNMVEDGAEKEAVDRIEKDYEEYIQLKDRVIAYYKEGNPQKGLPLHKEARNHFSTIIDRCGEYKGLQRTKLAEVRESSQTDARRLRLIAVSGVILAFSLGVILSIFLIRYILGPVRRLALEVDRAGTGHSTADEVKALSRSVRGLIQDVDHTHLQLEKSRETLLQAEKLAVIGRLAAGMAHSIRNPLTSVKMRLFSLGRTLALSSTQKDDFQVISEEIRHIDTIVQNFLEFSRPPRLKMQSISPSEVVNLAIQLLQHRLEAYNVEVNVERRKPLPLIQADPEQLKEVLVNLIENACEAIGSRGAIEIEEEEGIDRALGRVALIRLMDTGPGIPASIQDKVFQPFFTTKEEGTGLGLSIVARIVEEHGGRIELVSEPGHGATFIIRLPIKE